MGVAPCAFGSRDMSHPVRLFTVAQVEILASLQTGAAAVGRLLCQRAAELHAAAVVLARFVVLSTVPATTLAWPFCPRCHCSTILLALTLLSLPLPWHASRLCLQSMQHLMAQNYVPIWRGDILPFCIVLCSHEEGRIHRMFLGSTADYCARHSAEPVIITHGHCQQEPSARHQTD